MLYVVNDVGQVMGLVAKGSMTEASVKPTWAHGSQYEAIKLQCHLLRSLYTVSGGRCPTVLALQNKNNGILKILKKSKK